MDLLITLERLSFDESKALLQDKSFLTKTLVEFNSLHKRFQHTDTMYTLQKIKTLLAAYIIYYHKTEVTSTDDDFSEKIFELSKDSVLDIDYLFKNPSYPSFHKYFNTVNVFFKFFIIWKNRDSLILIRPMITTFYDINIMIEQIPREEIGEELQMKKIDEYRLMQRNIKLKIKNIAGDMGLEYLNTGKIPMFLDEKVFSDMEKTVKKAFWDVFEENMSEKKYECLEQMLIDLKDFIFKLLPSRQDLREEFEKDMDFDILFAMMKETNELDRVYIKNIMFYFISYLERQQAPSEDEKTNLFKEILQRKLETEQSESKLLRYFFENMFDKYENIKNMILAMA